MAGMRETGRSPGGLSKEKGWCVVRDLSRSEETMSPGGLFQVTTQKGALFTNPEVGGGAWLQTTKYEIGTILPKKLTCFTASFLKPQGSTLSQ